MIMKVEQTFFCEKVTVSVLKFYKILIIKLFSQGKLSVRISDASFEYRFEK